MAERPWRIDVTPVVSDDPAPAGPRPRLVPLARRRPWDRVVGTLIVAALALAVLKPWSLWTPAEPAVAQPIASDATVLQSPAATPSPVPTPPMVIALPAALFVPPPTSCMEDIGWHVCALGAANGQTVRNTFGSAVASSDQWTQSGQPAEPAVVLSTRSGGVLAFYGPAGFYSPVEASSVADIGGDPLLLLTNAWGRIAVSAWDVDAASGSQWLDLQPIGTQHVGRLAAGNAFLTTDEGFVHAQTWPSGRYVVFLSGGGLASWQQFFDFEVASDRTTNTP